MKTIKNIGKEMIFGITLTTLLYGAYLGLMAISKIVFTFLGLIFNI